jgi:starvation-inducible DNA-binding protein
MKAINQIDELDTPSDLKEKGREKVAESVNRLVADAFALYVKTKNFHWHMSGKHFRDYHLLLDEQAEQIFATIDPLAERVRKIGGNTIRSIAHIAQLQHVKDNDEDFVSAHDMLKDLEAENRKMAKHMREAHKIADDADDVATASLLEVYIDETERRTWFLFETTRD